jgi:hypothetical protein
VAVPFDGLAGGRVVIAVQSGLDRAPPTPAKNGTALHHESSAKYGPDVAERYVTTNLVLDPGSMLGDPPIADRAHIGAARPDATANEQERKEGGDTRADRQPDSA